MVQLNSAYYLSMIKLNSAGEDFKPFLDSIIVDLIATVRKKDLKTVEDKRQFLISRNLLPEEKQQELGIREEGYLYTLRADVEVESIPYVSNLQKKIFERAKDIIFVGEKVTSEHWIEEILNHVDFYVGEVRAVMQVDGHPSHYYRNRNDVVNATTDFNTNMLSFFRYSIYRGNDDDLTKREIREFLLPIFRATSVETAEGKSESPLNDDAGRNMFNHLSSSDDSDNETVLEEKSDTDSSDSAKVAEGEKVSKSPKKTKQIQEAEDNAVIETAILQVAEQDAIYKKLYLAVMRQEIAVVESYKQYISTSSHHLVASAALNNDLKMLELLLKHKADTNKVGPKGNYPVHTAVEICNVEMLELLLKHKADTNKMDKNGNYPVHTAVEIHNVEMLELLADYGARLNVSNKKGNTPLIEFSKFLASSELSIDNKNIFDVEMFFVLNKMVLLKDIIYTNSLGNSLLHLAAIHGHIGLVKYMLQKENLVDIANHEGNTPLHHAASHGHDGIVEFLLQKQASVNAIDESGKTALYRAACRGYDAIVKLLLKAGALVDSKEQSGLTPLHAAVYNGHDATVKLLLDKGASVDIQNDKRETPLYVAVGMRHATIAKILLDKGASVDLANYEQFSPLIPALLNKDDKMVELLLANGASIDFVCKAGWKPMDLALAIKDDKIIQLLQAHKAALEEDKDHEGDIDLHITESVTTLGDVSAQSDDVPLNGEIVSYEG